MSVPVLLGKLRSEDIGSRQILSKTLSPKITRTQWTGGVTQAIQHLLCNHKDLSSTPVPPKKKGTYYSTSDISTEHT
jgi:hypothetical protein